MAREINSVAVIGGGTMGSGIAGLCAQKDITVLLLEVSHEAAKLALDRIKSGRPPAINDPAKAEHIILGTIDDDLEKIAEYDWVCEAVVEDLHTKRDLFKRLEPLRKDGSIVSTNTSGIPLRDVTNGMPKRLRCDIAVTHFFNPVKLMKLLELIPGKDTTPDVIESLGKFCRETLGKGVVNAKDTVNFIGNRIGCYWMLRGLHDAECSLNKGLSMEQVDAQLSAPMGLPPTGLFGLVDLIGLDVMHLVGKNLAYNLPASDPGVAFNTFPESIHAMLERGQLGRKTGAGFYRINKFDDGSRKTEVFDLVSGNWREVEKTSLDNAHSGPRSMFENDEAGKLAWRIMGGTLIYAADLVPEIADNIVNIDRAMKWGYGWSEGPFEMMDTLIPEKIIEKLLNEGRSLPKMLRVLQDVGAETFYRHGGLRYLGLDGQYHSTPPE